MKPRVGSKKSVQQGRSHFDARSVLVIREHGKRARTPLAAFFNRPMNQWNKYGRVIGLLVLGLVWGMWFSSCDGADTTVNITAEEFRFSPKTVDLPPDQLVRIIVRNQGREQHVFESPVLAQKTVRVLENSSDGRRPRGEAIPIKPGERVELFMKLSPGLYRFWCRRRGHAGMEGTLMVHNRN